MQISKQNCTFPVQSILIINRSKQHATCHIRAIRAIRVQKKTHHSRVIIIDHKSHGFHEYIYRHHYRSYVPIQMDSKGAATCHIRAIRVQENNIIRVMNLSSQFIVKIIHQRRVPFKRVPLHLDERLYVYRPFIRQGMQMRVFILFV